MVQSRPTVLIFDVEPDARAAVGRVVSELGFELLEATSADTVFDDIVSTTVQLVLVDWAAAPSPPEGYLGCLRAAVSARPTQLLVTCPPDRAAEAQERTVGLGVGLVLVKPVDPMLLRQAIAGAVALAVRQAASASSGATEARPTVEDEARATAAGGKRPVFEEDFGPDEDLAPGELWPEPDGDSPWDDETSNTPLDFVGLEDEEDTSAGLTPLGDPFGAEAEAATPPGEVAAPPTARPSDGADARSGNEWADEGSVPGDEDLAALAALLGITDDDEDEEAGSAGDEAGAPPRRERLEGMGSMAGGIVVETGATAAVDDGDGVIESFHPDPIEQVPSARPGPAERPSTPPPAPGQVRPKVRLRTIPPSPPPSSAGDSAPPGPVASSRPAAVRPSAPAPAPSARPAPASDADLASPLPRQGTLEQTPFVRLLTEAFASSATGTLRVERPGRVRSFHLSGGRPVGLSCSNLGDDLIPFLFSKQRLDSVAGDAALAEVSRGGGGHAEILFRLSLVDPASLVESMREHLVETCIETFRWHEGSVAFEPGPPAIAGPPVSGVSVPLLLVEGMVRHAGDERLASTFVLSDGAFFARAAGAPVAVESLTLGTREARVLSLALGGASVAEVVARGGMGPAEVKAVLRALCMLGLLAVTAAPAATAPPRPSQPSARVARPHPTPRPSAAPPAAGRPSTAPKPASVAAPSAEQPAPGRAETVPPLPGRGLPPLEDLVGVERGATGEAASLWKAFRLLEAGRPRSAIPVLRRLAEESPESFVNHLYLGWATYAANRAAVKLAERCVLEASRLSREAPEPYHLMAEICTLEGQPERVEKFEAAALRAEAALARKAGGAPAAAAGGLLAEDDPIDVKAEMRRVVREFEEDERRVKEQLAAGRGGLLDRLLRGK